MAFDGTVVRALSKELHENIAGGRIGKISQPEKDEILLTIRGSGKDKRLLMSANPSLPLICFVNENKASGNQAPAFCMLLRKHIQNGKIIEVKQIDFERVIKIKIEHRNEMGDMAYKYLIIEIMGKHSNIILINEDKIILDGIKRITPEISSVRTVLPNASYFIPSAGQKINPFNTKTSEIIEKMAGQNKEISRLIYETISGFSPMLGNELCCIAGIDNDIFGSALDEVQKLRLKQALEEIIDILKSDHYKPGIYYDKTGKPKDFTVFKSRLYHNLTSVSIPTVSDTLASYYYEKAKIDRLRQKSSDLRLLVNHLLTKNVNKLKLQEKQLLDTDKRDKYKLYGELLNVYAYDILPKASFYDADNYYDNNNKLRIKLDPALTPSQNAVKYFEKYNKAKRTFDALSSLIPETRQQIAYLESIIMYLNKLKSEQDIEDLKEELIKNGFLKRRPSRKLNKTKTKSQPLHYLSPGGRDIFVGKNNLQNDELSFKFAGKNDWWFHSKTVPGSHVILKNDKNEEIPDEDFEAAARLAAYYSSNETGKTQIDYTQKKNLIKPPASPSGYVIYHTNYSMIIDNDISNLRPVE